MATVHMYINYMQIANIFSSCLLHFFVCFYADATHKTRDSETGHKYYNVVFVKVKMSRKIDNVS